MNYAGVACLFLIFIFIAAAAVIHKQMLMLQSNYTEGATRDSQYALLAMVGTFLTLCGLVLCQ